MAFELSTLVNWVIVAFIGFVFAAFFAQKFKDIWNGNKKKDEPSRVEKKIL